MAERDPEMVDIGSGSVRKIGRAAGLAGPLLSTLETSRFLAPELTGRQKRERSKYESLLWPVSGWFCLDLVALTDRQARCSAVAPERVLSPETESDGLLRKSSHSGAGLWRVRGAP